MHVGSAVTGTKTSPVGSNITYELGSMLANEIVTDISDITSGICINIGKNGKKIVKINIIMYTSTFCDDYTESGPSSVYIGSVSFKLLGCICTLI